MHNKHHIIHLFFCGIVALALTSCGIKKSLNNLPDLSGYNADIPERTKINDSTFVVGNSFLTKNEQGLWELYVEGDPLERGLISGRLSEEVIYRQEAVFLNRIKDLVPSKGRQRFLRKFLSWYNRKMYTHVPNEFKSEIYGISRYMSKDHDAIATPYLRALYLHAAHDIGHSLQDLALVGCTSFATWDQKTEDGQLLIGRNFDFYAGDDFAEDKVVSFINPDQGYKFMSISWSGFIGVVSGMNEKGLTVTLNAGKSQIPWVAKTPISIVTREILQYAATIDEAIAIAKKREVFVSEAIMVGSAIDHKAVVIEVSPQNFGIYDVENSDELICSNHFQSEAYKKDRRNKNTIKNSHSQYRYDRMLQLLEEKVKMNPEKAVAILRNKDGLNDKAIGYGNEKALNKLLAHHGIVFKPEELKVWVSANPYQLGTFVAYDLNTAFGDRSGNPSVVTLSNQALNIIKDPFLETEAYKNYEAYRILERKVEAIIKQKGNIDERDLQKLSELNPNYWKAYYLAGRYYYQHKHYAKALKNFETASTMEITTLPDEEQIAKYIKKSKRKLK
ncbi:acyl-CoA:6-aminopenicillanic acid acyl transferase [Gelidibacter algens]|uniref:Acyl-CoA:6-aminopenicillanic acid acyl transferase n=1 Tax=Gelidibacter algens TaxID=49280 RepID=A0A1A7R475_9FLAO|nr:C45 family peptidase [Gelidibacter algens]OBX26651.1 acyl-CoA--6-aminopenicillanic acid acyl-transferase [Gelidibacter algens]RAJ25708.1 acyl-CoA:6-aminopenicillanic acid acyl transferase [Gelidibacter algens]